MRLACSCHVSRQDGYNPADLGDRAGLEEEKAADELLVVSQQGGIGSGREWQNAVAGLGWFIGNQQGILISSFQRWSDRVSQNIAVV